MKLPRIPFLPALVIWIANTVSVYKLRGPLNEIYSHSRWRPVMDATLWNYISPAMVVLLLVLIPLFWDATKYRTAYRLLNLTCTLLGVVFLYRWWLQFVLDITAI